METSNRFRHLDSLSNNRKSKNCLLTYLKLISFPLIIYVLIVLAYFKLIPLQVENHSLILIGIILFIFLFFARHNGEMGYCIFCKRYDDFIKNFKLYVESNLIKIGADERSNALFDSFAKDASKEYRNENYSSIAAGIFPTLGILGTFISIAVTMPEFSTANSKDLERDISILLTGVGTAFYVSIYGIFLSIWWIFFEKKGISRFQQEINIIKNVTKNLFWTKEEIEQTHLKENLKNFDRLSSVFEHISSNQFLQELNRSINERVKLFDNIMEVESSSIKQTSTYIQKSLDELVEAQKNGVELAQTYESITSEVSRFNKELKELKDEIFSTHTKLYSKQEELLESFDKNYKQQHDLKDQLHSYSKNYISEINTASMSIERSMSRLSTTLKDFNEHQLSGLYSNIVQNLNKASNDIQLLNNSFEQRVNSFDENYAIKLKNTLEIIDSETAKIVQELSSLKEE